MFFTNEAKWLTKWDKYIGKTPQGSHLIFTDWLKSYTNYGFDFEVGLVIKNDEIIGGYGAVIPKFFGFKFYIIPHGPIFSDGYEHVVSNHFDAIIRRASELKCCYLQLSIPFSSNHLITNYTIKPALLNVEKSGFKKGKLFKHVYTSYGLNWINFNGFSNPEELLNSLTPKVRRNIRIPYNKNAQVDYATSPEVLKECYSIILNNAKEGGYSVRSFEDIQDTLINLVNKKMAYCIYIKVNEEMKASAIFFRTNAYLTNIMGGVIREKPDIKLGYMLQWEAIKKSFDLGFNGYNISMGGSSNVKEFKSRFNTHPIAFENPNYYKILNPVRFKAYQFFAEKSGPYKSKISKILSFLKK